MTAIRCSLALAAILVVSLVVTGCSGSGEDDKGGEGAESAAQPSGEASLRARHAQGVGHMGRYEYALAHDAFAEVAAARPDLIEARVNLAIATLNRQAEGDELRAMDLLRAVLRDDPTDLPAQYCLALLLQRNGDVEESTDLFRRVAEADPHDAYAAYFVGQSIESEDPEAALDAYERAIARDPYFRSAYYRAYQMLQRLGRGADAGPYFEAFQRLDGNPRAQIYETKYSRMGPKAVARVLGAAAEPAPARPEGNTFAPPIPLAPDVPAELWAAPDALVGVTACDLDGDGNLELFLPGALAGDGAPRNAIVRGTDGALLADHPLAAVGDVRAVAWGDYDNDGLVDAYFACRGPNHLYRQEPAGVWTDMTAATGTANGALDTVDVALVDADHDGDLDIFCVNADGPNELLNNDLDGGFRPLAEEHGLQGVGTAPGGTAARRVVFADLDADRDDDIFVLNAAPPHEVYFNDRLWSYRTADALGGLLGADIAAVAAADLDVDGRTELYAMRGDGTLMRWADSGGGWSSSEIGGPPVTLAETPDLTVADLTGTGENDLVVSTTDGFLAMRVRGDRMRALAVGTVPGGNFGWTLALLDPARGPALVARAGEGPPLRFDAGPGRFGYTAIAFTGIDISGEPVRSNASGLGTTYAARLGSRWVAGRVNGRDGGPGRSLQPMAVGLGGLDAIDFVNVDWSNSILQTEMALTTDVPVHEIKQTQRQLSSCPVLFVWDGAEYRFVSDVLGVGGMGYLVEPGVHAPPRPWEHFLLPEGLAVPRNGAYRIKLGEPMEEACYLDAVALWRYELPPGWQMALDERMGILGPEPTGAPRYFRHEMLPDRARNERGEDVTELVATADLRAAPVGALDRRFIGRLEREHVLELEFPQPLAARGSQAILVVDGWVEYPYSQTMFSAWQAEATYDAPTLEARTDEGAWVVVHEQFGYPAGMPRRMTVPLDGVPGDTTALRLRTNQEVYWDRIAVAWSEPCPEVRVERLAPSRAELTAEGFPRRTTGAQRVPHYDDADRAPFWDTRHMAGLYTELGPVTPLVEEADGALAIFGPGEDIEVWFPVPAGSGIGVEPGWTTRLMLESHGWCKDMDLFTGDGETVGPLPGPQTPARARLHDRFNTRYRSGS